MSRSRKTIVRLGRVAVRAVVGHALVERSARRSGPRPRRGSVRRSPTRAPGWPSVSYQPRHRACPYQVSRPVSSTPARARPPGTSSTLAVGVDAELGLERGYDRSPTGRPRRRTDDDDCRPPADAVTLLPIGEVDRGLLRNVWRRQCLDGRAGALGFVGNGRFVGAAAAASAMASARSALDIDRFGAQAAGQIHVKRSDTAASRGFASGQIEQLHCDFSGGPGASDRDVPRPRPVGSLPPIRPVPRTQPILRMSDRVTRLDHTSVRRAARFTIASKELFTSP